MGSAITKIRRSGSINSGSDMGQDENSGSGIDNSPLPRPGGCPLPKAGALDFALDFRLTFTQSALSRERYDETLGILIITKYCVSEAFGFFYPQ